MLKTYITKLASNSSLQYSEEGVLLSDLVFIGKKKLSPISVAYLNSISDINNCILCTRLCRGLLY